MAKKTFKIWTFLILFFFVVGYFIYSMTNMTDGDPNELCTRVDIEVADSAVSQFTDRASLEEQLKSSALYPEGQLMKNVNVGAIEKEILRNKFIRTVECYKTNSGMEMGKGKVRITVTQRVPVLYILPNNGQGYFVDSEGTVIPNSSYVTNIPTATGSIDQKYATGPLAAFGTFLSQNQFWNDQIEQIYVSLNHRQQPVVTLVPRVGNHTIYLGSINGFEKKLRRMQVFYEEGLKKVGWNKYSKINLEFDDQVVCTRR